MCDEARPICRLCANSEQECSYTSAGNSEYLCAAELSSQCRSKSPGFSYSSEDARRPGSTPLTGSPLSNHGSPGLPAANHQSGHSLDEAINFKHMELIIHATLNKDELFNLGDPVDDHHAAHELFLGLHTSLEYPYLMYQMLAFSARHLAYLRPERSGEYLHQAVSLQTRAIAIFKTGLTDVNKENCVAILLFSIVVGHHLLADTLAKRNSTGLDAFLTHFIQCIDTQRGIFIIAKSAWPLLMETQLQPILSSSTNFTSQEPTGTHCLGIKNMILTATGLTDEERQACDLAIDYLQIGMDAILADSGGLTPKQAYQYQMIFQWTMLAAPEFTALLGRKRPEALVILAYYTVLLHLGRSLWQVSDAGSYILDLIVNHIGSEWQSWLEYPRSIVSQR